MLNHPQELAGNRHVPSSTSAYPAHSCRESGGDRQFNFWCSSKTESSGNDCDRFEGRNSGEVCGGVYSPPLWDTYKGTSFKSKLSPLIPSSHHCCSVSPSSRSKAIAEGRKELMQMIEDLPESSFELSFQYMVEQQHVMQPVQTEAYIDEKIKNSINEAHVREQNKKKEKNNNHKPNQILRVESMANVNFLLKMFFPSSLEWKKKVKVRNVSKLSPAPSFHESMRQVGKEKRMMKSSKAGDKGSNVKDNIGESTNYSRKRSSKSRYYSNFLDRI